MYHSTIINHSKAKIEEALGLKLREYSTDEVLEMAFRMKDIEWIPGESRNIIAQLPADIQSYIMNELQMSKIDFRYWCTRYCYLVDDKGRNVPLVPWPSQEKILTILADNELDAWRILQEDPNEKELQAKLMLIILKSRQIGGTAISEALVGHQTIFFPRTRAIIASDHPDNSLNLFRVLINVVDSLPGWMKPVESARVKANNLHFLELGSDVITGAGNQKTTLGQGITVDCAHLTELSTWIPINAATIDADLRPAFQSSRRHHSFLLLESTAAGGTGNWFHDQWAASMKPGSLFKNVFIGWFMAPDKFRMSAMGIELTPDTQNIARQIQDNYGVECTKEQMAWYQTERADAETKGILDVFLQERPSNAEEAFQTGWKSAFTITERSRLRNRCKTPIAIYDYNVNMERFEKLDLREWLKSPYHEEKANNKLIIWETNNDKPGSTFVVGADAAYGFGEDSSAIEVLRVGNSVWPDEQVAEFRCDIAPAQFSVPCWLIGHMYIDKVDGLPAKMAVESNPGSPGLVASIDLQKRGYSNLYIYRRPLVATGGFSNALGWWTTPQNRPVFTEEGISATKSGDLVVNSLWTVDEMDSFVAKMTPSGRKKWEHADGKHDDRLMALYIALHVAHEDDIRNIADSRRKWHEQRQAGPGKTSQLWQLGLPWEEAIAKWEDSIEFLR